MLTRLISRHTCAPKKEQRGVVGVEHAAFVFLYDGLELVDVAYEQ